MTSKYKKINFIAVKLPALIILGMLVTLIAVSQITYKRFEKEMIAQSTEMGTGATKLMADAFPVDKLDEFLTEGFESDAYVETIKYYYTLKEDYPNIKYMYVWVCTKDGGIIVMDLDESYTEVPLQQSVEDIGTLYEYGDGFKDEIEDLMTGKNGTVAFPVYDNGEYILSVATPIFDESGQYVCTACVDMSMEDIRQNNLDFIKGVGAFYVVIMIIITGIIMFFVHKDIVGPMEKMVNCIFSLNRDSEKDRYEGLNRYESLNISTGNEIEVLYRTSLVIAKENLFNMSNYTKSKGEIMEMSEVAYKDALTRVGTKKAYDAQVQKISNSIARDENFKFALVMVDVNDLKRINDIYGHEKGDIYIKGCCKIVCEVFGHSPVYRVGGDEFIVYLVNDDYENRYDLCDSINQKFVEAFLDDSKEEYERYSAAVGMATFDRQKDSDVNDVFDRADKRMYVSKEQHKERYGTYR